MKEPSQSLAILGDYKELIKQLAHQQYIQKKMGTDAEFEKLWRGAFATSAQTTVPKILKVGIAPLVKLKKAGRGPAS